MTGTIKPDRDLRRKSNWKYYASFTLLFCVVSCLFYVWCALSHKTLIWDSDGYKQHYKALLYYGRYLRDIIRTLITAHELVIPQWDFCIGEGSDVMNTLHYYVIGDPIAFLSVLVPADYMHWFYSFSVIFRMYLAGITFLILVLNVSEERSVCALLTGAISYSFCAFAIHSSLKHPFFLNPMIYFPLMILGIEYVIKGKRPYLFVAATAICALCNFYFFYMIAILSAGYGVARLISVYGKDIRAGSIKLLQLGLYAIAGTCMAGIIFIPMLFCFLGDSRISETRSIDIFYPIVHYAKLPSMLVSGEHSYWLFFGWTAPVIVAVLFLFIHKGSKTFLRVLFLICTAMTLTPLCGRLMNGMSYPANRWCWAFSLLSCFILVDEWENILKASKKEKILLAICCAALFALVHIPYRMEIDAETATNAFLVLLVLFVICISSLTRTKRFAPLMILLIAAFGIVNSGCLTLAPAQGNYVKELMTATDFAEKQKDFEGYTVRRISDYDYTRYSGNNITCNTNLITRVSSSQYYWTISNPYVAGFREQMETREGMSFSYYGYDDRTSLMALSGVQYYVRSGSLKLLPYGYTRVETGNSRKVFENDNILPMGYTYDRFITEDEWNRMDPVQKQEAMLEAAYVQTQPDDNSLAEYHCTAEYEVPCTVNCVGNKVSKLDDNTIVTTTDDKKIRIDFNGSGDAETYIRLKGLRFEETQKYDLYGDDRTVDPNNLFNEAEWNRLSDEERAYIKMKKRFSDEEKILKIRFIYKNGSKTLSYRPPDSNLSSGRVDYIVNTGYREGTLDHIDIVLPMRGTYHVDDISVYCVPMEGLSKKVSELGRVSLENMKTGPDSVTGNITTDKTRILCMAIPYSDGWKLLVDGKPEEIIPVNERYIGSFIEKGSHDIEFIYSTPYRKVGGIVSAVSLIGFAAYIILMETKSKRRRTNEKDLSDRAVL